MPHQCVHCGKVLPIASKEILEGCASCGSKFFFYIKDEQMKRLEEEKENSPLKELENVDKEKVEQDVRSILGIEDESKPIILDLESVSVKGPGKFELDLVSLMNQRPIVFKLEEGKYIIDLESSLPSRVSKKEE